MKRFGYILLSAIALLVIFTLSLAQLETKNAKYLLRVLTGSDVRGYYGSAIEGPYNWTGQRPMFAVSASGETDGPTRTGQIFFYDSLLSTRASLTITSPTEGELFGLDMSGGGDWNGDGTPDLAVSAPNSQVATKGMGRVYVYLGGPEFGRSISGTVKSDEDGDGFGEAIRLKDDINGDGLADLVVGAPRSHKAGPTAGRVYIWYGKHSGSPSGKSDVEIPLGTTNDLFGTDISTGDVNGDGKADLAIGAPHHNIGDKLPGSVFLFLGGPNATFTKPSEIISGEGTTFQDEFGRAVAIVQDMNGDQMADLVIGAPQVTRDGKQVGKVYVYAGGSTISKTAITTFWGNTEAGRFGDRIFALGDLNGDSKGDWAVQARDDANSRGVIYLYYGGWDKEFYKFSGESSADQLGNAVAKLGSVSGGPAGTIAVGARWNDSEVENGGRVYLLAIE
jgi:hypothetical protein